MTIGKKIAIGFVFALVFLASQGLLLYWTTISLVQTGVAVAHTHDVLAGLEKVLSLMKDDETGQRGFLLTENTSFLAPFLQAEKDLGPALANLRKSIAAKGSDGWSRGDDQEKHVKELEKAIAESTAYTRATVEIAKLGRIDDLGKQAEEILQANKIGEFLAEFRDSLKAAKTGMDAAREVVKLGKGKEFMDRVRTRCEDIERAEKKNLEDRQWEAQRSVLVAKLTIAISTAVAFVVVGLFGFFTIRSINLTVRDGVSKLATAGAEIQASAAQQAAGAQEQAAAVAQTVTTVNEVSQTAEQSAERARSIGDAAQRTLEIGKTGRKVVDDSLQAMGAVKEKVETTAQNILLLAEQAQAIGDIIASVNDIAEQTNILALNAAIEASRAGEEGRGFSVVAGEVKALADQSKKATAQIRQILGEIQKATNIAVLSTEEVTRGVASAIKVGDQAGTTIKTLTDALADMVRTVSQIAASVGQQATGMSQIHQAMKNIDSVARQNTMATRQATQAAEKLNALGTRLARFIGKSQAKG